MLIRVISVAREDYGGCWVGTADNNLFRPRYKYVTGVDGPETDLVAVVNLWVRATSQHRLSERLRTGGLTVSGHS